jgi:molybdopterin-synthase adenylyltransferase
VDLGQLDQNSRSMKLTKSDLKRFSKQIILKKVGIIGQKKIFNAKVLVVGAGGIGCPLLLYLANSGVGHIGIIDDDKIEISNLNRQILFTKKDLGFYKVDLVKKSIKKINNKIKVRIFKEKLNKKNILKIFKEFDIICDGTDNFYSRYLINDYCLKMKKILISAAISKFDGHLFKFDFKKRNTPCFRCFMPEAPTLENNCDEEGIISPLAGVIGSLQAMEVIKTILNIKNDLSRKILIFDALKSDFRTVKLLKNYKCINKC